MFLDSPLSSLTTVVTAALATNAVPDEMFPGGKPYGWGSLGLQLGAFGLLCYMVIRLIPEQMALARAERQARDTAFFSALDKLDSKHDVRNDKLVAAIEKTRSP